MAKKFIQRNAGGTPPQMLFDSTKNIQQIQNFNNAQIYTKGFQYATQANSTNEYAPVLGGKARQLHGIVIVFPTASVNDDDILGLSINSENVIETAIWKAYNPNFNYFKNNQFYDLKRALSGSDSVLLNLKSVNAHNFSIVFYLSNM